MTVSRWTHERFRAMRLIGDEHADAVIATVFREHGAPAINEMMLNLGENDELITEGFLPVVVDYLNDTAKLPTWADPEQMAAGSLVFNLHGPEVVMLLFGASLPVLYADPRVAHVLALTHRMTNHLHRRIIETAQFVMDVTDPTAFAGQGRGIRTTQKVRLMHAAVRHLIEQDSRSETHWKREWGVPVSQLDLAGTLMSFTTTIFQGLQKTNIRLSLEQQEAYLHLWKVIGHILGIHDEYLPENIADANELTVEWMRFAHASSEAGKELANVLATFIRSNVPPILFRPQISDWMRFWLGEELANLLGLQPYNWEVVVINEERQMWGALDRFDYSSVVLQRLNSHVSRRLLEGLLAIERGGNREAFRIPDALREQWGVRHPRTKRLRPKESK